MGNGQSNHIVATGKTGMRRVPIYFSVPFLAQYLNLVKDLKSNPPLWWNLKQSNIKGQLDYGGTNGLKPQEISLRYGNAQPVR